jgi:Chaperone of endosialidase
VFTLPEHEGYFPLPMGLFSNGRLGILAASARYKRDVHRMGKSSQGLFRLRPVTFRYKQDAQGERQYGLIAEEGAKIYPELVVRGAKGR